MPSHSHASQALQQCVSWIFMNTVHSHIFPPWGCKTSPSEWHTAIQRPILRLSCIIHKPKEKIAKLFLELWWGSPRARISWGDEGGDKTSLQSALSKRTGVTYANQLWSLTEPNDFLILPNLNQLEDSPLSLDLFTFMVLLIKFVKWMCCTLWKTFSILFSLTRILGPSAAFGCSGMCLPFPCKHLSGPG